MALTKGLGGSGGGGSSLTTKDEGGTLSSAVTTLDFVGAGVTASGAGATTTVTIPGNALTVKDEGSNLTTAATSIDFVGAGVTATNSSGAVTVTIPGGSPTAPTLVQSAYLRGNSAGSIALGSAPTVGHVMLLLMVGATNGSGIPSGWTTLQASSNGGTSFQKAWAAYKLVKTGETGSVSVSASDWHNLALFELDDLRFAGSSVGKPTTSGSNFTVPFLLQSVFGAPRLFVAVEHDSGITLSVTQSGFSTLQTYGASSNHWGVLANSTTVYSGEVAGTSASTFSDPIYLAVWVGK